MYLPEIKVNFVKRLVILHTVPEWNFYSKYFSFPFKGRFLDINLRFDNEGRLLAGPLFSAPKMALILEIALKRGLRETLAIGWAGKNPGSNLNLGDLFIPVRSISLEGTSKFYFFNRQVFYLDDYVLKYIEESLSQYEISFKIGTILSADIPWRVENFPNLTEKLEDLNFEAIDMETSAFYCLSEYYGFKGLSLHFITDEYGKISHRRPEETLKSLRKSLLPLIANFLEKGFS
ncbi:MAG: hypothetical protein N2327_07825 [Caldimicrobium sp.]|nr:hypothetical protein [Caldimicrobium sp.]MCX7874321.1 hypothetical protein [Caldimicrobium sp.]MDW8094927.1 hypothetical protein [Caldimicrobium sp.]